MCRRSAGTLYDPRPEEATDILERLCRDAAGALRVPVAWIGVLDESGEAILAASGSRAKRVPSDASFAARIASATDLVVVPDMNADSRFVSHPMVVQPPRLVFYAGAPIFDAHGQAIGALSVLDREVRTLSENEKALLTSLARHASRELELKEELREAGDRFRDFFEQTSDLVMSLGPDGTVLHANETALTLLGIARSASLLGAADPEHRGELRHSLTRVFKTAEAERIETVFISAGGTRITLEGWLRPRVMNGRTALVRVVFRDVSDRKVFEAELGNARDAALEAARAKTQFLTNVSHEIRTPMNGILGMIDLLMAGSLNEEQQDYAYQARASADQLLSIVHNILYISNLEAGTLSAATVDFDLHRALQRIVEVMKVAALGKDLEVSFVFDATVPPVLRGNLSKLRQVVTNLLENAIKFTTEGAVVLTVELQTETETHRVVRFEVRDSGIGIPYEDRLVLFERFTQLDAGSNRRYPGVGMGLSTARHLVETMGGLIDVESTPGQGSRFWFTIPFPKVARGRRPIASSELDLKDKRLLLVDREATSRKVLLHYLVTTWEMHVDLAANGLEALSALRQHAASDPYHVVVYDRMDDLDPLGFARTVRADSAIAGTSLLHLISSSTLPDEEVLREAGINAYTTKPVGQRELFDALAIALAHEAIALPRPMEARPVTRPVPVISPEGRAGLRVLVAEDNFLNMKLTMSQLDKLGYNAQSVTNGREALEAVTAGEYDVIIMDCQMPVMDGYQATVEIRRLEREKGRRHHIIAMTANALEGDREKCLAAGMDDYLAKPTRHEELEKALAQYSLS